MACEILWNPPRWMESLQNNFTSLPESSEDVHIFTDIE